VCSKCDSVLGTELEEGPEWRNFANNEGDPHHADRSRVGMPNDESLGTIIGGPYSKLHRTAQWMRNSGDITTTIQQQQLQLQLQPPEVVVVPRRNSNIINNKKHSEELDCALNTIPVTPAVRQVIKELHRDVVNAGGLTSLKHCNNALFLGACAYAVLGSAFEINKYASNNQILLTKTHYKKKLNDARNKLCAEMGGVVARAQEDVAKLAAGGVPDFYANVAKVMRFERHHHQGDERGHGKSVMRVRAECEAIRSRTEDARDGRVRHIFDGAIILVACERMGVTGVTAASLSLILDLCQATVAVHARLIREHLRDRGGDAASSTALQT